MLWFPAVQEGTDVRLSMVLTRNMYVLWDRTRCFEDCRIHRPRDCSLYCFLPVQNVSRPRGRGTSQTVSQMTSWQNGCNSRSCSPIPVSLCRGQDGAKIPNSSQESEKILLLMVDRLEFFPHLCMPDVGMNICIPSIFTPIPSSGEPTKSQAAKPCKVLYIHHVQDKQRMSWMASRWHHNHLFFLSRDLMLPGIRWDSRIWCHIWAMCFF